MGPITQLGHITWVGTFSIGPTCATAGSQHTLSLTPQIEKIYTAYEAGLRRLSLTIRSTSKTTLNQAWFKNSLFQLS